MTFLLCLAAGCFAVERMRRGNAPCLFLLRAAALLPAYAAGHIAAHASRPFPGSELPPLARLIVLLALRAPLILLFGQPTYLLSDGTYFGAGAAAIYGSALLGIAFWMEVARLLAPGIEKCRLALYASRHTMDILIHHFMGFFAVNCVFLLLNIASGAKDFSIRLFRMQGDYVCAPEGNVGLLLLYLAAGLLLPLGIAWGREWLCRKRSS